VTPPVETLPPEEVVDESAQGIEQGVAVALTWIEVVSWSIVRESMIALGIGIWLSNKLQQPLEGSQKPEMAPMNWRLYRSMIAAIHRAGFLRHLSPEASPATSYLTLMYTYLLSDEVNAYHMKLQQPDEVNGYATTSFLIIIGQCNLPGLANHY
jgi:hypothetical protein